MKVAGLLFFITGLATFAPARFDFQVDLLGQIAPVQPWGGMASVVVGTVLLVMSFRTRK